MVRNPSLPFPFKAKTAASLSVEAVASELPAGLQELVTTTRATNRSAKILPEAQSQKQTGSNFIVTDPLLVTEEVSKVTMSE